MQCANCTFENMPGMKACVRCGSVLEISDISLEPPRATRLRLGTRIQRMLNPLGEELISLVKNGMARLATQALPRHVAPAALLLTIIPGLGHLHMRQRLYGGVLLGGWLAMLLLSLITLGTTWQNLPWFIAISLHAYAFMHLFAENLADVGLLIRALIGLCIFLVLNLAIYTPLARLGANVYTMVPVPSFGENDVVQQDDVLLQEGYWLRPDTFRRGDLVVYRISRLGANGYIVRSGFNLDRIVGVPGDRVKIQEGEIFVNGKRLPAEQGPLAATRIDNWETTIRAGQYMILPTCLNLLINQNNYQNRNAAQSLLRSVSIVDQSRIRGRIVYRLRPLQRIGLVR